MTATFTADHTNVVNQVRSFLENDQVIARMVSYVLKGVRRLPAGRPIDDLAQEARLKILSAVADGRFDPERGNLTQFAVAVAGNTARDWLRSKDAKQRPVPRDNGEDADSDPVDMIPGREEEPGAALAAADEISHLRGVIARALESGALSDKQGEMVEAWLVAEGKSKDAAYLLGMSPQLFCHHWKRVLSTLHALLTKGG